MFRRFAVSSICVAVTVSGVAGVAQERWSTRAPFRDLDAIEGISTSNDEYSISLYWSPQLSILTNPGRPAGIRVSAVPARNPVSGLFPSECWNLDCRWRAPSRSLRRRKTDATIVGEPTTKGLDVDHIPPLCA